LNNSNFQTTLEIVQGSVDASNNVDFTTYRDLLFFSCFYTGDLPLFISARVPAVYKYYIPPATTIDRNRL